MAARAEALDSTSRRQKTLPKPIAKPRSTKTFTLHQVDEARRIAEVEVLLRLHVSRVWPNVRLEELAQRSGIEWADIVRVVKAKRTAVEIKLPERVVIEVDFADGTRHHHPPAPPGFGYCIRCREFVEIEEMGKNRSRPTGLSNLCKPHWREYFADKEGRATARIERANPSKSANTRRSATR